MNYKIHELDTYASENYMEKTESMIFNKTVIIIITVFKLGNIYSYH